MARYFMEGTQLAGWERMMMDPTKRTPTQIDTVYHGTVPLEELMRDAPTEPGRQGPQMGGVSC